MIPNELIAIEVYFKTLNVDVTEEVVLRRAA